MSKHNAVNTQPAVGVSGSTHNHLARLCHETLYADGAHTRARFDGYTLSSVYQPIFGLAHQRAVGYEGLLRAHDAQDTPVAPLQVFERAIGTEDVVYLDRACRALHTRNFAPLAETGAWLFLNVNPRVVVDGRHYGPFFAELLLQHQIAPHQIVVEVLENSSGDIGQLAEAVGYYRELGCLVAIDDFGAGHSNFDRIVRLQPDMVKLDRSLVMQARDNRTARRLLPSLIALLHEAGSLVVAEGVEDEADALLALDANADFVQGYYFARPVSADHLPTDVEELFAHLAHNVREQNALEAAAKEAELTPYIAAFQHCVEAYGSGAELSSAAFQLLAQPRVARCYVLDENGVQVERNVAPQRDTVTCARRFAPLCSTTGADWSRRPYFRRALHQPGHLQTTRPYLSITGAHLTVTLSQALYRHGAIHVLCCDLRVDAD